MLPMGSLRDHAKTLCMPERESRIAVKIGSTTIQCRMSNVECRMSNVECRSVSSHVNCSAAPAWVDHATCPTVLARKVCASSVLRRFRGLPYSVVQFSSASPQRSLSELDSHLVRDQSGSVEHLVSQPLGCFDAFCPGFQDVVLCVCDSHQPAAHFQGLATFLDAEPPAEVDDGGCDMAARMHNGTGKIRMQQHLAICHTGSRIHPQDESFGVLRNELKPLLPGGFQSKAVLIEVIRRDVENTVQFKQ